MPFEQRGQKARGQPEGMEDRQRVEEHVVDGQHVARMGLDLIGIGHQIGVRQHHALGLALRAGGEQHHGRIVGPHARPPVEGAREPALDETPRLVDARDLLAHVLEKDAPRRPSAIAASTSSSLPCSTKRRDVTMVSTRADLAGRFQVAGPGGEIEQRRHAAEGVETEQRHRQPLHVGQQHADIFARLRQPGELAPENQRAEHQPAVGDRAGARDPPAPACCDRSGRGRR